MHINRSFIYFLGLIVFPFLIPLFLYLIKILDGGRAITLAILLFFSVFLLAVLKIWIDRFRNDPNSQENRELNSYISFVYNNGKLSIRRFILTSILTGVAVFLLIIAGTDYFGNDTSYSVSEAAKAVTNPYQLISFFAICIGWGFLGNILTVGLVKLMRGKKLSELK